MIVTPSFFLDKNHKVKNRYRLCLLITTSVSCRAYDTGIYLTQDEFLGKEHWIIEQVRVANNVIESLMPVFTYKEFEALFGFIIAINKKNNDLVSAVKLAFITELASYRANTFLFKGVCKSKSNGPYFSSA